MSWLGSAAELGQLIAAVASPAVAGIAIYANLRTTRYMLNDKHEERLWARRADLYVDLIRLIENEPQSDANELWMAADTLDHRPDVYWQSSRDRSPQAWADIRVRVSAYASDRVVTLYTEWDRDLLKLAELVQPERVTGAPRPKELAAALQKAAEAVNLSGDRLRNQIRAELQPVPRPSSGGRERGNRRLIAQQPSPGGSHLHSVGGM
jgi:hypothetical protein